MVTNSDSHLLEQHLAWKEQALAKTLSKDEIQLRKEARPAAVYFICWWAAAVIVALLLYIMFAAFVYYSFPFSTVITVEHALLVFIISTSGLWLVHNEVDCWGITVNATCQLYLSLLRHDVLFAQYTPTVLSSWRKCTPFVRLLLGVGLSVFFIARTANYVWKSF